MIKLLLHVCCAPCATVPTAFLQQKAVNFAAYFYNPNILPATEHNARLDTFKKFADELGIKYYVEDANYDRWKKAISKYGNVYPLIKGDDNFEHNLRLRKKRCTACYRNRFEKLAQRACELEYDCIGTTLSISPYQFRDEMAEVIANVSLEYKLMNGFEDYSKYYWQSVEKSREYKMYRQNYCGCSYSKIEAELERKARSKHKQNAKLKD